MYNRLATVLLMFIFFFAGAVVGLAGQDIVEPLTDHVHFYRPPDDAVHLAVLAAPDVAEYPSIHRIPTAAEAAPPTPSFAYITPRLRTLPSS